MRLGGHIGKESISVRENTPNSDLWVISIGNALEISMRGDRFDELMAKAAAARRGDQGEPVDGADLALMAQDYFDPDRTREQFEPDGVVEQTAVDFAKGVLAQVRAVRPRHDNVTAADVEYSTGRVAFASPNLRTLFQARPNTMPITEWSAKVAAVVEAARAWRQDYPGIPMSSSPRNLHDSVRALDGES